MQKKNCENIKISKESLINFRSFLIVGMFLIAAILLALLSLSIIWLGTSLFILLIFLIIFFIIYYKKKDAYKAFTFFICMLAVCFAYFSFILRTINWSEYKDGTVQIAGVVESDRVINGQRRIFLTDAVVDNSPIDGRIVLYVDDMDNPLSAGMVISLSAKIKSIRLVDGNKINTWAYKNKIKYTANASDIQTDYIKGYKEPDFFVGARNFLSRKLIDIMGSEYGSLAYGMITGDKDFIDSDVKNYFSTSGLGHILAVSGLHLGVVSMALVWLLKRLRARRKIIATVLSAFIVFYVFLAGFSPSILRAAIMSLIGVHAYIFGGRRDSLSALFIAFCVITTFYPILLFDAGFILSISCVFGITLFYFSIYKRLIKLKIPHKISSLIAVGVSVQIGILPSAAFFFDVINVYSLIANIILVPFISFVFISIICCLLIAIILPFSVFEMPLKLCGFGLGAIDSVAQLFASLPLAKTVIYLTPMVFICYVLYFCISKYLMTKRKKLIILLCIPLCFLSFFIAPTSKVSAYSIVPFEHMKSNLSLVSTKNDNYLIGDFYNGSGILKQLKEMKIKNIKAVFINEINSNIAKELLHFNSFFQDLDVYLPSANSGDYSDWQQLYNSKINLIVFDDAANFDGGICAVYQDDFFCGYGLNDDKTNVLFVAGGIDYSSIESIEEFDIIRSARFYSISNKQVLLLNTFDIEDIEEKKEIEKEKTDFSLIFSFDDNDSYAFNYKTGNVYKIS